NYIVPMNMDTALYKMEQHNPNPDEWVSMSWNDWYKSAQRHNEPTDTPIEAPQPLLVSTTTPVPNTDSWFVAMIAKHLIIPASPETLKLATAIYEASVEHLPNIDWVSLKGVAKLKTAIIRVMNDHNYPPPSSGIYRDTVVDDIVLFFEPGQLDASADEPTFSNGESYTNGKDHSASTTTPPPAPMPATTPDVLKSLIDQFRPLELNEITLMIQALEHVRKEKTEGASVA
ncbi:MAG TPA: hypothetical protein PLZ51_26710, partial [Aggregatilineales bacterium]|nr:hypothetical protein [Aggregatilineales bacterium]